MDYKSSGVDIDAGNETVRRIRGLARSTFTAGVLSDIGSFGGLFQLEAGRLSRSGAGVERRRRRHQAEGGVPGQPARHGRRRPGQPLRQRHPGAGRRAAVLPRLPGHRPAVARVAESIVGGMAAACRENGCALLGGETAEMPGFYADGEYDIAGFIVGAVERERLVNGRAIAVGDVLVGVPSSGLHTNGYSLARRIVFEHLGLNVDSHVAELGTTVGEALLEPHRSYLPLVQPLLEAGRIKGMAHITGGGITDNLPRILPHGTGAVVNAAAWEVPPLFRWLQDSGRVPARRHAAHVQHGHRPDHRHRAGSVRGADRGARRARRSRRARDRRDRRRRTAIGNLRRDDESSHSAS